MTEKEDRLNEIIAKQEVQVDRLTGDSYNYMTIADLREELIKYKDREVDNTEQERRILYRENNKLQEQVNKLQEKNQDDAKNYEIIRKYVVGVLSMKQIKELSLLLDPIARRILINLYMDCPQMPEESEFKTNFKKDDE